MIRLFARRAAGILAILLFLATLTSWGTPYFYVLLLAAVVVQLLVQRSTEIGWRIFRHDLDERQEALKARILDLSYRWLIGLSLLGVLASTLMRPLFGLFAHLPYGYRAGPPYDFRFSGSFGRPGLIGDILPPHVDLLVVLLIVIFFLPGMIAAWIEPVPKEARGSIVVD